MAHGFVSGRYRLEYANGFSEEFTVKSAATEEALRYHIFTELALSPGFLTSISLQRGGNTLSQIVSTIRPAPGGSGGPFFVVSELDGVVQKVTTGITTLPLSLDQCKTDQAAAIGSLTFQRTQITTTAV